MLINHSSIIIVQWKRSAFSVFKISQYKLPISNIKFFGFYVALFQENTVKKIVIKKG